MTIYTAMCYRESGHTIFCGEVDKRWGSDFQFFSDDSDDGLVKFCAGFLYDNQKRYPDAKVSCTLLIDGKHLNYYKDLDEIDDRISLILNIEEEIEAEVKRLEAKEAEQFEERMRLKKERVAEWNHKRESAREEQERQEYERLKAKFEGK